MVEDYATGRAVEYRPGRVYMHTQAFKNGEPFGASTHGYQEPHVVNAVITALSDVLHDAPEHWADHIHIVVR